MGEDIDKKIAEAKAKMHAAHEESVKYYAHELKPGEDLLPVDGFKMALAFKAEELATTEWELALSEKFPQHYPMKVVEQLKRDKEKLLMDIDDLK
jgi:hypothetical protein